MLHFTKENGLPSNMVYSVYKDSKGFLWIATDKGIARYNGIDFEIFNTFSGVTDNEVFGFNEDSFNRLWLATYNGELCFYKNGIFHNAANTPFLRIPFKTSYTADIKVEKDSSVTIYFYDKSKFLNFVGDKVFVYNMDSIICKGGLDVGSITFAYSGVLLREKLHEGCYRFITAMANYRISNYGKSFLIEADSRKNSFFELFKTWRYPHGNYLANDEGVFDLKFELIKRFKNDSLKSQNLTGIYRDSIGNWFYTTSTGIFINDTLHTLFGEVTTGLTEGFSGDYWISTLNNGIFVLPKELNTRKYNNAYSGVTKFSNFKKEIIYFSNNLNNLYSLSEDNIKCIYDYEKSEKTSYMARSRETITGASYIDANNKYYSINSDKKIIIDNVSAKKVRPVCYTDVSPQNISFIFVRDGKFLFKRPDGIVTMDTHDFSNSILSKSKIISGNYLKERIYDIHIDSGKTPWYSTLQHMYKLVGDSIVDQKQFKNIAFKRFDFFNQYLIGYTHNNKLLICSNYDTRPVIDSVTNQNCVWDRLFRLDSTHVLVSTDNLYRVIELSESVAKTKASVWAVENQFLPLDVEEVCSDGKYCYFFKNGSITKIDVNTILQKPRPPNLFITAVKTSDTSIFVDSLVSIPYNKAGRISISYLPVSFESKQVSYAYSISKDETENWQYTTLSEIELANPGYGVYTVKIKAKTLSSEFGKPASFMLIIERPYWATWWFITIVAAAVILIIVAVVRYRIRAALQKKDKEYKQEVRYIKSEYKALNALMNPHFIFNTLNNVQSLVNKDEKRSANEYIRIFSNMIRQNMHNTAQELITLKEEIDLVSDYLKLEKLRFKTHLNYEVSIDENIDLSEITVPPLIIQPLVENSIKHGLFPRKSVDSIIQLTIVEKNDVLIVEVRDNGIGLKESAKNRDPAHKSLGLENIKRRINHVSIIHAKEISLDFSEVLDAEGKLQWTIATVRIKNA